MSLPAVAPNTQVLVTGASSGIGAEISRRLAARGHDLTIVARRRDRLSALCDELVQNFGVEVSVYDCDLGDQQARHAVIEEITAGDSTVVGLCNCAGFGTSGRFLDLDLERELEMVEVNLTALVELTHVFARPMVEYAAGAVLNVASLAGFQPNPLFGVYGASKTFVQSFSEAIHEELHGTGVSCTVLSPGPVPTEWAEIADADLGHMRVAEVSVEDVAKAAVEGMIEGKRSVIPGLIPKVIATSGRFAPRTVLLPIMRRMLER